MFGIRNLKNINYYRKKTLKHLNLANIQNNKLSKKEWKISLIIKVTEMNELYNVEYEYDTATLEQKYSQKDKLAKSNK